MEAGPLSNSVSGRLIRGPLKGTARTVGALNRLQPSLPYFLVKGAWWLHGFQSIPDCFPIVQSAARLLPHGELDENSWSEVHLLDSLDESTLPASSPSGQVERYRGPGVVIDRDGSFRKIFLTAETNLEGTGEWKIGETECIAVPVSKSVSYAPLLPSRPSLFVGGLISLSAEPPEGFFAAATSAEFQNLGYRLESAERARVWLYRVPDSRTQSYFDFHYASPDRPRCSDRSSKFLIASGVGPASDPASAGGRECHLLWLGDEQHGPLQSYLETLTKPFSLDELARNHKGLAQRLTDGTFLLSSVNFTHNLSKDGFNELQTDPELYRRVFSEEYDQFLMSLFEPQPGGPAQASYLLATSRGCTQGCSICCSGGLKAFQSFSGERMMSELRTLAAKESLRSHGPIDIFFLDSNFNNNPKRIVEFAQLYRESDLYGRFRFYVRHNTVKGFLKRQAGVNVPDLELVQAFRTLGITEVFMGVDTFDEASTLTLKSNRVQLARRGEETSATYTPSELRSLVAVLESEGISTRAFYLQNNPWVSDFDRLESYYHIADLWFNFAHFSIDTRERQVNQLKPFAGSPIEQINRLADNAWTSGGRFVTGSEVGELDEMMSLSYFGKPRHRSNPHEIARLFILELDRVRAMVEDSGDEQLLAKLLALDEAFDLHPLISSVGRSFAARWSDLGPFDPRAQKEAFQRAARPLFDGLADTVPQAQTTNKSGNSARLRAAQRREPFPEKQTTR